MISAPLFRLLGDEVRLRILGLLARERLNVSELTSILGIAQPGVSRHLRLLREGGLVAEERRQGWTYYRAVSPPELEAVGKEPLLKEDADRLQEIRRLRREEFREHGENGRVLVPGRSWAAWARALGHLLPPLRVADLGSGEGYLSVEMARWAREVVAVDRSRTMLSQARGLALRRGARNIRWKRGEIEKLPLPDGSFDLALLAQSMHHAQDPLRALREAARILKKGGRLLVLDLKKHREEWVRRQLGDRWLGFTSRHLIELMRKAGFQDVRADAGSRRRGDPFKVLIASGTRRKSSAL